MAHCDCFFFLAKCEYNLYYFLGLSIGLPRLIAGEKVEDVVTTEDMITNFIYINKTSDFLYGLGTLGALYLNSVLISDIYLTLKDPLNPQNSRIVKYQFGLFLITVLLIASSKIEISNKYRKYSIES